MIFLLAGIAMLIMKALDVSFMVDLSWWWCGAPFVMAFLYWEFVVPAFQLDARGKCATRKKGSKRADSSKWMTCGLMMKNQKDFSDAKRSVEIRSGIWNRCRFYMGVLKINQIYPALHRYLRWKRNVRIWLIHRAGSGAPVLSRGCGVLSALRR